MSIGAILAAAGAHVQPCVGNVPQCGGCSLPAVPRHCCRCSKPGEPCGVRRELNVDLATGRMSEMIVYCGID